MLKSFILISCMWLMSGNILFAQKQSFDVVSYTMPKGWEKTVTENAVQLSTKDDGKGNYAAAVIVRSVESSASATENFTNSWNTLVNGTVQVTGEPALSDMGIEKGWKLISGQANYTHGSTQGIVTLITATANEKMASVVVMSNTNKYQDEVMVFVNSLELTTVTTTANTNNQTNSTVNSNQPGIIGIWGQYNNESGTSGYDWREYYFYADGTYQYLQKNISYLYQNDIIIAFEKGTYKLSGNKLEIIPLNGTTEIWSKAGSDKAGKLLKTDTRSLEKISYAMDLHYFSGIQKTNLVLQYSKQTLRDGPFTNNADFKNSWLYQRPYNADKASIELPAGTKIQFNKKSFAASSTATEDKNTATVNVKSPVTGKIWEAQSLEKHGAAYGNTSGFHSGGFWKYQYRFNADGTYQFVYSAASAFATNPVQVLQYETGTYAVDGNQIIITPLKGANEEWSVDKVNNGMSAEHIREVLNTRLKRLKSTTRKLEKITYQFSVEFWEGNDANALCLKHTQNTVREGSPGQNDQSCFFETTVARADNFSDLFK